MIDELYKAAHILYTAGSLTMFYSLIDNFVTRRKKIPKKPEGKIDLKGLETRLPEISLLVPAYGEQKVIGNTLDTIAGLNYPTDKYNVLFLVDEKEDIGKKEKGEVIVPLAREIISKGGFVYADLFDELKEKNPKYSRTSVIKAADGYLKDAQLLAMSFLRESYQERFSYPELEGEVVSRSFSILNGNSESERNLEEVVGMFEKNRDAPILRLVDDVTHVPEEILDNKLWELFMSHDLFNTTKDVIKKKLEEKRDFDDDFNMGFAVVPNNFNGNYPGKMLDYPVASSKGRALNYGLDVIDAKWPQTEVIGIYDADGRPHEDVLAYIGTEAMKMPKEEDFFFQGPIYLVRNFNDVDWVCKHSGLSGTLWHRVQYPLRILRSNKPGVKRITHFSGTNYFFTKKIVESVKGWPPFHPTEDLGLAYKVYMEFLKGNIEKPTIKPHPFEEIEQTTQNFSIWRKQQYRWSSGYRYQAGEVLKSDLPARNKVRLLAKLVKAPATSTLAFVAGVSGLSLLAATALGAVDVPKYAEGFDQAIKTIMTMGFATFMSYPSAVYLWSLKNKYIPYKNLGNTLKNIAEITATNIPYSIMAQVPNMISWVKGLKGWGRKTPRSEERTANKEQEYLEEILESHEEKSTKSVSWFNRIYKQTIKKAKKQGLSEITLGRRAAVDYKASEFDLERPSTLSRNYSKIVENCGLHKPVYTFRENGRGYGLVRSEPKYAIALGTRPEIIKMAPIIQELERQGLKYTVIHSGQHYSKNLDSDIIRDLGLPIPNYNLGVGSGSRGEQIAKIRRRIDEVFREEMPDIVLVQGDTNTVLASAIAASKLGIKVGHVEAGLRSYDRRMPEEVNRIQTDKISDYLFAPTLDSRENLLREGFREDKVYLTGNTIVEATIKNLEISTHNSHNARKLIEGLRTPEYAFLTLHRPSNVDSKRHLSNILNEIVKIPEEYPLSVVFPLHPRTRKMISIYNLDGFLEREGVMITEPVGYLDCLHLQSKARVIVTDSGGLQEEANILGVPCITLRENTERPETLTVGSNILVGKEHYRLIEHVGASLKKNNHWDNPFGDGKATEKIIETTQKVLS